MKNSKIIKFSFLIFIVLVIAIVVILYLFHGFNNTSNTIDTPSKDTLFTDDEVKFTLSNYLELQSHVNCDSLLENLTDKGKLNYVPSKDIIQDNGIVITSIKVSDYKEAMLNYVSEEEFQRNWFGTQYFTENTDGYLVKFQGGGGLRTYTIMSIKKIDDFNYSAKTYSIVEDDVTTKQYEAFDFTLKDFNGNCVIDFITSYAFVENSD